MVFLLFIYRCSCNNLLMLLFHFFHITSKQTDVVTSMKALFKLVEVIHLSSRLDGTLSHSYCDWMELHQVSQSPQ